MQIFVGDMKFRHNNEPFNENETCALTFLGFIIPFSSNFLYISTYMLPIQTAIVRSIKRMCMIAKMMNDTLLSFILLFEMMYKKYYVLENFNMDI